MSPKIVIKMTSQNFPFSSPSLSKILVAHLAVTSPCSMIRRCNNTFALISINNKFIMKINFINHWAIRVECSLLNTHPTEKTEITKSTIQTWKIVMQNFYIIITCYLTLHLVETILSRNHKKFSNSFMLSSDNFKVLVK